MNLRLCVTNIGFRSTEADLRQYFSRYGHLSDCKLRIDAVTGDSRGFAYVTFTDAHAAERCLQETSHRIHDKAVTVFSDSQAQESTNFKVPRSKKLFISLLGLRGVSEMDVYKAFGEFGQIASIEFDRDKKTNEPQYCILYFRSHEPVDVCVARSHCIQGRQVFVRRATSREEVKLAEQRERELQAAKAQAKKVFGAHCPTQNVTIVQPRLFSSTPSLLAGGGGGLQTKLPQADNRKRTHEQSSGPQLGTSQASSQGNSGIPGYGYM